MDERADAKDTTRTEGFSDGIFAIAVTLLVLDLTVPRLHGATPGGLVTALRGELYPLGVLALSFATIFIMWVNHHRLFLRFHHVDTRIIISNGLLLLLVTICPFPTALAAEYLGTPAGNIAAAVYAGYFVLVNLAFNLLVESAARGQHAAKHGLDGEFIRKARQTLRIGFAAYVTATVVAFWSAWLGLGICAVLWIFWAADMFRTNPAPSSAR